GTPTGQVTFTIDGTTTLTGTLTGGTATVTTSDLTAGDHTVVATYVGAGDPNFTSSTSTPLTQTVNQATTTTSVSSSPDPSVFGQPVLFTATVAPVAPGAGTPTGTVTFTIDGDVVPVLLDENSTATLTRAVLPAGTYSVTADY
ncbi:Ig-like domain-containing protein, partial [Streptomyces sp. GC420]|uniref:Ig-like domain-containing protein n=1 Tax=Streptomyces sp. GC420 TaxID=2697568 RepID=UPI001414F7A5